MSSLTTENMGAAMKPNSTPIPTEARPLPGPRQYPLEQFEVDDINNRFTYHSPFGNQTERYFLLREGAKNLALMFLTQCPPSRERSLALTHLENAIMWANASIARNEKE